MPARAPGKRLGEALRNAREESAVVHHGRGHSRGGPDAGQPGDAHVQRAVELHCHYPRAESVEDLNTESSRPDGSGCRFRFSGWSRGG
jgi:hypothetical protein